VGRFLGADIRRYRPERSEFGRLASALAHHRVNLVLDIGANVGQFGTALRRAGYKQRILSFEPLTHAHALLVAASRLDALWEIAPRMALGSRDGETEIHVAGNSVSSSVLDMLERHVKAAPASEFVGSERVPISTLDTFMRGRHTPEDMMFLKIDTQGYEDRVLDGASELQPRVRGLQLELSLVPLYEGQVLFDELRQRISAMGFATWAIWPGFFDAQSGRMLQVDVVFFRD
jgi:FkbM family methyltransferase